MMILILAFPLTVAMLFVELVMELRMIINIGLWIIRGEKIDSFECIKAKITMELQFELIQFIQKVKNSFKIIQLFSYTFMTNFFFFSH